MKMGCVFSRQDFDNINPRVFQVWNIDSEGRNVKPGKIEVTESQLILYQKGDVTVRWPLRSLRRYGFDAELFSFECGRRCPTGPGVYAFKCRRAEALFNILQECLQNSGGGAGNISIAAIDDQLSLTATAIPAPSMASNGVLVNGSAGSHHPGSAVDSSGYLEPITSVSSHHQCSQSGQSSAPMATPRSSPGGFVCIHSAGATESASVEWSAALQSSLSSCCNLGPCSRTTSHNYVNSEVSDQAVSGSAFPSGVCVVHQYVNSSVIDHSHRCCPPRCYDQTENAYVNSAVTSPCATICSGNHLPCAMNCVDLNTNYAKLDDLLKQEQSVKRHKEQQQHFYVNVKPEQQSGSTSSSKCVSGRSSPTDCPSRSVVTSPTGSLVSKNHSSHFYANLGSPTSLEGKVDFAKESKHSPQVNYAVLDLDHSGMVGPGGNIIAAVSSSVSSSTAVTPSTAGHSLPSSPVRTPEGYVQIDFDRTAALSANPCPFNDESVRKTRHNAVIPCASMPS